MKNLKLLLLLLVALFLMIACNDDDSKSSDFYLDLGQVDSNQNVEGKDFGIYKWDITLYQDSIDVDDIMDDMVIVVPYNEQKRDLIFSGSATLELTIQDSTYYGYPIDPSLEYEDFYIFFSIDGFNNVAESYTIKFIHGDEESNYTITIPYVNYVYELSHTNVFEDPYIDDVNMTLEWELAKNNS